MSQLKVPRESGLASVRVDATRRIDAVGGGAAPEIARGERKRRK